MQTRCVGLVSLGVCAGWVVFVRGAAAEATDTKVQGTLTSDLGTPLSGVTVVVRPNAGTEDFTSQTALSEKTGTVRLAIKAAVRSAVCEATLPGYRSAKRTVLAVDGVVDCSLQLTPRLSVSLDSVSRQTNAWDLILLVQDSAPADAIDKIDIARLKVELPIRAATGCSSADRDWSFEISEHIQGLGSGTSGTGYEVTSDGNGMTFPVSVFYQRCSTTSSMNLSVPVALAVPLKGTAKLTLRVPATFEWKTQLPYPVALRAGLQATCRISLLGKTELASGTIACPGYDAR